MVNGILSPQAIRARAEELEKAKLREALAELKKKQAHEEDLHAAFLHQELQPDWQQRLNRAIETALEQGKSEVLVLRFPAEWCTDHGRAINNFEDDWPATLTGLAKRMVEVYERELRPLGYKAKAQILNFPGGMPGEVGIFLRW